MLLTVVSFLFFTGLVAALTWWITRRDDHDSSEGYFLAGRSLSFPLIAGSLLLTNLSTEQMVGLNGDAYDFGLCVMVWEVVCVIALVFMAWFFLPRFLKSGVATVPEYLRIRFDSRTQLITNVIFLVAYVGILLPIILYTGARGMIGIMDVESAVVSFAPDLADPEVEDEAALTDAEREEYETELTRVRERRETIALWIIVWLVGIVGSIYALFGGLRTVAVSDTLNGVGLFVGGFLITGFALAAIGGDGGMSGGAEYLWTEHRDRFNSIGGTDTNVPFYTIFSGIFLLNLFYWTTNQQIIQRTFGASSLAEGQKGVLLTGALKLLGPLYLVLPGILAYAMVQQGTIEVDTSAKAYGTLVRTVLPDSLRGFFAAVMVGAILSSFNSALNSACTLFSLGLYKEVLRPEADDRAVVRSGAVFGWIVAILAMSTAPLLANTTSIFGYLQKMNGMYFIPIFAVVLVGMLSKRVPAIAAQLALLVGFGAIATGYFVPPFNSVVNPETGMHEFQFLGTVFAWLVVLMLVIGEIAPRATEFEQQDVGAVDMTPWRHAKLAGFLLIVTVLAIYITFADFSVYAPDGALESGGALLERAGSISSMPEPMP